MGDAERHARLKDRVEELPRTPGVYLLKDDAGRVVYVGKARNLRVRVSKPHDIYQVGQRDKNQKKHHRRNQNSERTFHRRLLGVASPAYFPVSISQVASQLRSYSQYNFYLKRPCRHTKDCRGSILSVSFQENLETT